MYKTKWPKTLEPKCRVYNFQVMVEKQYTPICESHREENILLRNCTL